MHPKTNKFPSCVLANTGAEWRCADSAEGGAVSLTESSKSPASIAKSNKQWGDLLVSGGV